MDDITFTDNSAGQRFELLRGGVLAAHADYRMEDGAVVLTHTEVLAGQEGKGLGTKLAGHVVGELRKRGARIVPQCDFMAGYIARHPAPG